MMWLIAGAGVAAALLALLSVALVFARAGDFELSGPGPNTLEAPDSLANLPIDVAVTRAPAYVPPTDEVVWRDISTRRVELAGRSVASRQRRAREIGL